MYGVLIGLFSPKIASWLCAFWYVGLLIGIVLLSVEQPAEFHYANR